MGLKLLRIRGSSEGFFSNGWTRADLKLVGKSPVDSEQFKMAKISGPTVWKISLRNLVGMVSSGQEVEFM